MKGGVRDFVREYPAAAELAYRVRHTQEELYGAEATIEKVGRITGAYLPRSREFHLPPASIRDHQELTEALRHEVLGHYGLNTFAADDKRAILDAILRSREREDFREIWRQVDANYSGQSDLRKAEEIYCFVAEKPGPPVVDRGGTSVLDETCFSHSRTLERRDLEAVVQHVIGGLRQNTRRQLNTPAGDNEQFRLQRAAARPTASKPSGVDLSK